MGIFILKSLFTSLKYHNYKNISRSQIIPCITISILQSHNSASLQKNENKYEKFTLHKYTTE